MEIRNYEISQQKKYKKGERLYIKGERLYIEGERLYTGGGRLYTEGGRLYIKGERLYDEGERLYTNKPPVFGNLTPTEEIMAYKESTLQLFRICQSLRTFVEIFKVILYEKTMFLGYACEWHPCSGNAAGAGCMDVGGVYQLRAGA